MIGDEVKERVYKGKVYEEVKAKVDEALFPLFREQCRFLRKREAANEMVLNECRHPKNKFINARFKDLPNCAYQGCPIYDP